MFFLLNKKQIFSEDEGHLSQLQLLNFVSEHVLIHYNENALLREKIASCCKLFADKVVVWKENCPNFYLFKLNK